MAVQVGQDMVVQVGQGEVDIGQEMVDQVEEEAGWLALLLEEVLPLPLM